MPYLDQANIACGFHGGDPLTMQRTLALAAANKVSVGAHPAYPDLVGFGRRSMAMDEQELRAAILYQVAALDGMALSAGVNLDYVKPHGALYNDMMARADIRGIIMDALQRYHRPLKLMLQATGDSDRHREEAATYEIPLLFEAFADRCYDDNGLLLSRREAGAVHERETMLQQVEQLAAESSVTTVSGKRLQLQVDTLCVHGDNEAGVQAIREIRALLVNA
ncbi:MAG: UPF0271 protein [Halieaceae bacterium]|jgi:UPF0271 protein